MAGPAGMTPPLAVAVARVDRGASWPTVLPDPPLWTRDGWRRFRDKSPSSWTSSPGGLNLRSGAARGDDGRYRAATAAWLRAIRARLRREPCQARPAAELDGR